MKTQKNKLVCSTGFGWSSLVPLLPIWSLHEGLKNDYRNGTIFSLPCHIPDILLKRKSCLLSFPSFLHGFQFITIDFRNESFVRYSRNWSVSYLEGTEPHIWWNLHMYQGDFFSTSFSPCRQPECRDIAMDALTGWSLVRTTTCKLMITSNMPLFHAYNLSDIVCPFSNACRTSCSLL